MSGSAGRRLRRQFTRQAGGSMERAQAATELLEDLSRRTAALNQKVIELESRTAQTFKMAENAFNELVVGHNTVAHAAASIVLSLRARGIEITPAPVPVPLGAAPGAEQGQTAGGLALPPGVSFVRDAGPDSTAGDVQP